VAQELGLPPWWLNEQATVYISGKDDPGKRRVFDHPGLRVMAASPEHVFAMKALAARPVTLMTCACSRAWPGCGLLPTPCGSAQSSSPTSRYPSDPLRSCGNSSTDRLSTPRATGSDHDHGHFAPGGGAPDPKRHVHAGRPQELAMIMGGPPVGHGRTSPKIQAPPTRLPAWSSSGLPTCHRPQRAHLLKVIGIDRYGRPVESRVCAGAAGAADLGLGQPPGLSARPTRSGTNRNQRVLVSSLARTFP